MPVDDLLSQLRDIHLPAQPGWWPLAAGWWLTLLLIFLAAVIIFFVTRQRKANKSMHNASLELKRISDEYRQNNDANQLALSLSAWLRRVSLYAYHDRPVAGLAGQSWLEFLDKTSASNQFTSGIGRVFGRGIYDKNSNINAPALVGLCEQWLESIKPRLLRQART